MNKMAADGHASVICVQWSKPDDAAGPCVLHMCLPGVCCCDGAHQIHRDGGIQYRRLYCFFTQSRACRGENYLRYAGIPCLRFFASAPHEDPV